MSTPFASAAASAAFTQPAQPAVTGEGASIQLRMQTTENFLKHAAQVLHPAHSSLYSPVLHVDPGPALCTPFSAEGADLRAASMAASAASATPRQPLRALNFNSGSAFTGAASASSSAGQSDLQQLVAPAAAIKPSFFMDTLTPDAPQMRTRGGRRRRHGDADGPAEVSESTARKRLTRERARESSRAGPPFS